jgi:hypothetical protein
MTTRYTLATARVSALVVVGLLISCGPKHTVNPRLDNEMPATIVWAWERPEDLRFLDPAKVGVAFLAQTIFLENERVTPRLRRQPLEIAPGSYVVAVTRIETNKEGPKRPTMDQETVIQAAELIKKTVDLPDVRAIQIDFDSVVSERGFYRSLITEVRRQLPPQTPLTMTSLASWCTGDAWFNDFPVDEAVPMVFQMGADDEKIKTYLRNGNDWREPLCRGSYGLALEEPLNFPLAPGRRTYFFKSSAWRPADLQFLK